MKQINLVTVAILAISLCSSFKPLLHDPKSVNILNKKIENSQVEADGVTREGKAYWYSYYNNGNSKKLYITQVYNNNCNYCSNEITGSFKKWLILNDYENTVTTVNIDNLQDVDAESLQKRREATIIKYKGYGYSIVKVGFSYKED